MRRVRLSPQEMQKAESARTKFTVPVPKQSKVAVPPAPAYPKVGRPPTVPAKPGQPGLKAKSASVNTAPSKAKNPPGPKPKAAKTGMKVAKYPKHYQIVNHLSDSWLRM